MRRLFWIGVGAAAAVLVAGRVTGGVRELATAVREGMKEREQELRFALGLDTHPLPEGRRLDADGVRTLLEDPTGVRPRSERG